MTASQTGFRQNGQTVCQSNGLAYSPVMEITVNPRATVDMRRIGHEGHPLLIIDDFLLGAEALVDFAATAEFGPPRAPLYPGVNAALPEVYQPAIFRALRPSLARAFGLTPDTPVHVTGFLALSTLPLDQLQPRQRIPHYDFVIPNALAILHYLTNRGGTGFFRHTATGFESINAERRDIYGPQLDRELAENSDQLTTFTGPDTPNFSLFDAVDARFNRLVVYRSAVLHCALFDGATLTNDPRTGRLTANTFVLPNPPG